MIALLCFCRDATRQTVLGKHEQPLEDDEIEKERATKQRKIESGDDACRGSASCAILKRMLAYKFSEGDLAHLGTM